MSINATSITTEELLQEMAQCLRKAGYEVIPPKPSLCLVILQWKQVGYVGDYLDLVLATSSEEAKQTLRRRHQIPDASDSLQILNMHVMPNNHPMYVDGQRYTIRILEGEG